MRWYLFIRRLILADTSASAERKNACSASRSRVSTLAARSKGMIASVPRIFAIRISSAAASSFSRNASSRMGSSASDSDVYREIENSLDHPPSG